MTTTAIAPADQIRAALKAAGIKRALVSVRHEHYSMGSTIRIRVKDASVKLSVVEAIANEHQRIDRDHFGEILSGCNRFVDVEYTNEALAPLVAELAPIFAALTPDGIGVKIRGGKFEAFRARGGAEYTSVIDRTGHRVLHCWHGIDGAFAARQLAQRIADPPTEEPAQALVAL